MRVESVMTGNVIRCNPETKLEAAVLKRREIDSGILPVVRNEKPVGVITDRDICLALTERNRRPSDVTVGEVMSRSLWTAYEDDDTSKALALMQARHVRRLPVLNSEEMLAGILSMNDIVLHAEKTGNGQAVSYKDALETLKAICEHRYPAKPVEPVDVTELARSL